MRFSFDPTTDTEGSEVESTRAIKVDIKGKGKARDVKSTSPVKQSVRISVPPRAKSQDARRLRASGSSGSSSSSASTSDISGSDDDEDSFDDDDSDSFSASDSEEDEYPVNPTKAEVAARRRLNQYPAYSDPLEAYLAKQQKKAWQQAQASHNRDLAALRNIRLNAFNQAREERKRLQDEELEVTRLLLEDMNMRRQREEEEVDKEFNDRNQARWAEINKAISQMEQAQSAALAVAQQRQAEAEKKAKEMREAEMRKMEQEKEQQRQKEEEQKRQQEDKERQQQQERDEQAAAASAADEKSRKEKEAAGKTAIGKPTVGAGPISTGSALLDAKREFDSWHEKVKILKRTVLPAVSNDKALKNACWKLKRSLSTRISNVSASAADIQTTASTIHGLLSDAKAANMHAYLWSLNLLSKKITEMAGNNSEPDLSPVNYALGQIVVALLLADHGPFAEILMARFVKRCPYIVPFFPSKGNLSPAEHSKLLGRKEGEPPISYKQRMSGIMSLYAAIVQTSPTSVPRILPQPTLQMIPSYFRPEGGWKWCASIVRPPLPLLEVTALVMYTFLRMTSERFYQLFGQQYIKLLRAIAEQAIDNKAVKWNDSVMGDLSKIRLMIREWMEKGAITGAEGRIPT